MAFGQPFYAYGGNGYNTQNNGYVAPQPQYGNFYGQSQNAPQNANGGVTQQYQAQQQQQTMQNTPIQQVQQPQMPVFGNNGIAMSYVNGIEGAKAHIMPPNSEMWLIDSEGGFMYHKSTDYVGKAVVRPYVINEVNEDYVYAFKKGETQPKTESKPQVEYVTLADYKAQIGEYQKQITDMQKAIDELRNRKPINNNNGGKKDNV